MRNFTARNTGAPVGGIGRASRGGSSASRQAASASAGRSSGS